MAFDGNDEPVRFAYNQATKLAEALRNAAQALEDETDLRRTLTKNALAEWKGVFATEFRQRMVIAVKDARELAQAMRTGASQLDALATAAREEQERRDKAVAWQRKQDSRNIAERAWETVFDRDEKPPFMKPNPLPDGIKVDGPAVVGRG